MHILKFFIGQKLILSLDLLLFSANMIHRGIYGNYRLSFDIIFCDNNPEILNFRNLKNLPIETEVINLDNTEIFEN